MTQIVSLEDLIRSERRYQDYEFPSVTVVVPTFDCSEKIHLTIESVLSQEYPDFELIIVDAGSTDRTMEVIRNYRDERIKIYTVSGFQRYEMLNKGISQASGDYINFLFPGDFYIHKLTLYHMMEVTLDHDKPQLAFCGTFLRDGKSEPKILLRELSLELLRRGQQPTSLQSCWFSTETVKALGKFNTSYTLRGGYELMCRFCLNRELKAVSTPRVLIDYDLRYVTLPMVTAHFWETWGTVCKYFGFSSGLRWIFIQKDFYRIVKLWLRGLKVAFFGR